MKRIIHNFFHENRSTLNGIMLLILIAITHRFFGFTAEVQAGIDVALSAAAIKFLTGSDSGSKPPEPPKAGVQPPQTNV